MFGLENIDWGALGQKLGSPEMGVAYGNAAQAITPQGSWQHGLGAVGTGMNKSQIAAKAADEESKKQQLYHDAFMKIAGLGMTEKDAIGGTNLSFGPNGDFTYKGRIDAGMGPFSVNPGVIPGGVPGGGAPAPTQGGAAVPKSNIGDLLANFPASPESSSASLAGLTPEEISAIMTQRTATNTLNLNRAKTLYDMRQPKAGQIVSGPDFHWKIDPYTGEAIKTDVPAYHAPVAPHYPPGFAAANTPKEIKWWDKDGKSHVNNVLPSQHNDFVSSIEAMGGQVGEQPGQVTELTKFKEDRAKRATSAEMVLTSGSEDVTDGDREIATGEFFRTAPDEAGYFYRWDTQWGNEALRVSLPTGWSMKDFRDLLKSKKVPFAELMKEWDEKYPKNNINQVITTIQRIK